MTLVQRLFDGKIIGSPPLPTKFDLEITPLERTVSPAVVSEAGELDRINEVTSGPHTAVDYLVRAENTVVHTHPAPVTLSSLTPDKCLAFQGGYVRQLTPGTGRVQLDTKGRMPREIELALTQANPTVTRFKRFAEGTLGRAAEIGVDSRIAGKNPLTAMPVFTSQDHPAGIYVRNPACWAHGLPIQCVSPWNSRGANTMAGCAISPSFVLHAAHFPLHVGDTIRFITSDNQVITRTITAAQNHPAYTPYHPDIRIAKLDTPLPASIPPAKLLPPDYELCFPHSNRARFTPLLAFNQYEEAIVRQSGFTSSLGWNVGGFLAEPHSASVGFPQRAAFAGTVQFLDSGNPVFLVIGQEVILATHFTYTFGGTALAAYAADMQAMMDSMGSNGESLSFLDLQPFAHF